MKLEFVSEPSGIASRIIAAVADENADRVSAWLHNPCILENGWVLIDDSPRTCAQ